MHEHKVKQMLAIAKKIKEALDKDALEINAESLSMVNAMIEDTKGVTTGDEELDKANKAVHEAYFQWTDRNQDELFSVVVQHKIDEHDKAMIEAVENNVVDGGAGLITNSDGELIKDIIN